MALVLAGLIAAMAEGHEDETLDGRVWLTDDGTVAAVTRPGEAVPAGFTDARRIELGDGIIYPGLIDLHSHLGYNTMPLWADPGQSTAYLHHDSWPGEPTYQPQLSWPAWTLAEFAPESLLAHVQVRALAGGTTAIQGWPAASRTATNRLLRSVDNDSVGPLSDPVRVSALTMKRADLRTRAENMRSGRAFIYHCAEGRPDSIVTREFDDLETTGCLQDGLVAVHTCALDATHYARWRSAIVPAPANRAWVGSVVWSPFSNLWLYGETTDIPAVRAAGLSVCLGTDWGPSGTRNLLGEIKVARMHCDTRGWEMTDHDLVRMVTAAPGDALARAWQTQLGRLVPGAFGDVMVVSRRTEDAWTNLVTARERDVQLVLVGSQPRWGTAALMSAAGIARTTAVRLGATTRRVPLARPDNPSRTWTWTDVRSRLDSVRASAATEPPAGVSGSRGGRTVGLNRSPDPTFGDPPGTPPIVVKLDMPGGPLASAGPPPKGQTVQIPPIEPIYHDPAWLKTIRGRGFHGGALDGLAAAFGRRHGRT